MCGGVMSSLYDDYFSTSVAVDRAALGDAVRNAHLDLACSLRSAGLDPRSWQVESALDVACGYGRHLLALREMGVSRLRGVDISGEQVAVGQALLVDTACELVHGDAEDYLKTLDQHFDLILFIDVFEHLPVEKAVDLLRLAAHSLTERGQIVIRVPNARCPLSPFLADDVTHLRAFSPGSIRQTARMAGVQCCRVAECPIVPIGKKARLRSLLWRILVRPLIRAYFWVILAGDEGVHTPNLIVVCRRAVEKG